MSINRGLATAAACLVVIAAGSSGSTAHCGGEASAGSQPRRRVRAPGCAAKCDRKRQYERLLRTNPAFRQARMGKECGPITDPQLHQSCLASSGSSSAPEHYRSSAGR